MQTAPVALRSRGTALGAPWHRGTQGSLVPGAQCAEQVDTPRSYSALSNGLCGFCIISIYRCCIQTQLDDLPLAQVGLCCTLIVRATVIPRTSEAPPKVQSLQCFSLANTFTVHFQTNVLHGLEESDAYLLWAVHVPFLLGWICTQLSPVLSVGFVSQITPPALRGT